MYAQQKEKRTFVPATPEYHRLRRRKSWLSLVNILVVLGIIIALIFILLIIL